MKRRDRFIDNKHPFHLFLEYLERNPERALLDLEFLKNSWSICPLFNQALHHIFNGSDLLYKTLAKFQNTPQFWEENYKYYWEKVHCKKKQPPTELEKILNKFMNELSEYNKRKNN